MQKPDLAIVILNWNGKSFLEQFLPSVVKHSDGHRVVLADNASTDDSVQFVRSNFAQVEIVVNESNTGFAGGYNDALKNIQAEYYVLLNSDVEVSENWLNPLLECMQDPKIAGCQPKILAHHNKHKMEHAGACGGFIDRNYFPFCRGRIFEHTEEDQQQYDSNREVFWASGACLLIRSQLFHEHGGFDINFFAHMEEIDLCWRMKRQGYKFMAIPTSVVYHVGGGTLSYLSPRKTYLNFRNSLYMIVKNHDGLLFPTLLKRMCIDGVGAVRFILKGEFKQFGAVFNAHMSFYKNIGRLLKQRRELKKISTDFNDAGMFRGNILWNHYIKGVSTFSNLNQRLFK